MSISIGYHLKVLDDILRSDLIPNLTGRPPPNDVEMELMALPARLGGLGIGIPSLNSDDAFDTSLLVTAPLRKLIYNRDTVALHLPSSCRSDVSQIRYTTEKAKASQR